MNRYNPFTKKEMIVLRERAMSRIDERHSEANSEKTAALRKIIEGADEFIRWVEKLDKDIAKQVKSITGRDVDPETGYIG